jgi:hypothetical protein
MNYIPIPRNADAKKLKRLPAKPVVHVEVKANQVQLQLLL